MGITHTHIHVHTAIISLGEIEANRVGHSQRSRGGSIFSLLLSFSFTVLRGYLENFCTFFSSYLQGKNCFQIT